MNILILDTLGPDAYVTFYTPEVMEKMNQVGNVDYLRYERTEEGKQELIKRIRGRSRQRVPEKPGAYLPPVR